MREKREKNRDAGPGQNPPDKIHPGWFLLLHAALFLSSLSGICSKLAGRQDTLWGFGLWYGGVLALMALYALFWQQILKRLPLTLAYANKPIGLVWGMVWGKILFGERVTWHMILGSALIFLGIYLVVTSREA